MVTRVAEKSPYSTGAVIVIDCQVSSRPNVVRSSLTDEASAVLGTKHVKVLVFRESVGLLDALPSCG